MSGSTPDSNSVFCTNCGTRNATGQRFCSNCGTALQTTATPIVVPAQTAGAPLPAKKKRSFFEKLLLGAVGMIAICVVLSIIVSLVGNNSSGGTAEASPSVNTSRAAVVSAAASTASASTAVEGVSTSSSAPAASTDAPSAAAEPSPAAAAEPSVAPSSAPVAAQVGEDVRVGDVRWKILEATDAGQKLTSPLGDATTQGRFIRLRFEVENLGSEQRNFGGITLLDAQQRAFEASTEMTVFGAIPDAERCTLLEPLPANLPKTCQQVYEVPGNAAGLQARVGDLKLFGAQEALVGLGIADPETAAVVAPAVAELGSGETGAVGQDIKVGEVRWKVLEATDAGNSIKTPAGSATTAGKFLRVRVEVENMSSAQLNFTDLELSDNRNRKFQTASSNFDLLLATPEDERCIFEALPANLPKTCQVYFELPADAAGLKLKVGDLKLFGAKEAVVDLGQ